MRRTTMIFLAAYLTASPLLASDGGQASTDPSALKRAKCPRLPDDINLGGGLYMCARIDCSPPPGYTPPPGCNSKRVTPVPNGHVTLINGELYGVVSPGNVQLLTSESAGAAGYDSGP